VLRKILPTKVTVTPLANGGWKFSGLADYTKVLQELGLDAVTRVLEEATAKSSGSPGRSLQFGKPIGGEITPRDH